MVPGHDLRDSLCDYGQLFPFVPGDPGNPFVALWQADLVQAMVLLTGGLVLVAIGRARGQQGRAGARYLGYAVLVGAAASVTLTVMTLISSTPLACGGAPGAGPASSAEQQTYQWF
jgi:hypothetical protein